MIDLGEVVKELNSRTGLDYVEYKRIAPITIRLQVIHGLEPIQTILDSTYTILKDVIR